MASATRERLRMDRIMMKDRTSKKITEAELQAAMGKFFARGGIIRKLPDQKIVGNHMVGVHWDNSDLSREPS
jgi:hypothetical protein